MTIRIIAFSVFLFILAGCANKNNVTIEGNIKARSNQKIYLNRIDVDTYVRIDSAKTGKSGNFRFRFKAVEPDFYQIVRSDSDFVTILTAPGEKVKLNFTGKYLYDNYQVTGSVGSRKIKMLDSVLAETKRRLDSLKTVYNIASKNPGFDLRGPELQNQYLKVIKNQRTSNIDFIIKNLNSFASIKALYQMLDKETYVLYEPRDLQYMKIVSDTLIFHYPKSKQAISLKKNLEKEMGQFLTRQIQEAAKNAPETKLDPDLKDLNGKRIALSSLKGKVVLLTFWSLTSQECLAENLAFKELYKIYKPKGFEIYQINLDENEASWKTAVNFDELPWISVREDDPLKPVNARLFNVQTLPANYLFDRTGKLISVNLHNQVLQIKLAQIFGN
jgi:hypothetical protein